MSWNYCIIAKTLLLPLPIKMCSKSTPFAIPANSSIATRTYKSQVQKTTYFPSGTTPTQNQNKL